MNWPAPELLPPPEAPVVEPDEGEDDRRARSGLPAATWIALLGGALVLVAAASVVVSSWDAIGRSVRVLGLAWATAACSWAPSDSDGSPRRRRTSSPTSGRRWSAVWGLRSCPCSASPGPAVSSPAAPPRSPPRPGRSIGGGSNSSASSRWPRSPWRRSALRPSTGTTGGVIAALAALVWLLFGAERRPAALAIVAVSTPTLTALADAGIGAGTFARAGLVGERLGWSGPVVGLLSSMVLAVVARRRRGDAD
ncbi:MAG: hypothetical protein R2697_17075 [Ilumatobacteraceae bacterium]